MLLSQQMLDAIKHITDDNFFSFRKTAHRCIVCVTQSKWVKMWFSCFPVLTGSAEAQVIWGSIVKRLLITYFIGNISAKKISKSIHVHQSYNKLKVGRFLRHGVQYRSNVTQYCTSYRDTLRSSVQKCLNRSRCRLGCGLQWAHGIMC